MMKQLMLLVSFLTICGCAEETKSVKQNEYHSTLPAFDSTIPEETEEVRVYSRAELEEMKRKGVTPPAQDKGEEIQISIDE